MRFYFSEVDAELTGKEMLMTVLFAIAVCAAPFVLKFLLGLI